MIVYACTHARTHISRDNRTYLRTYACTSVRTHGSSHIRTYVYMYTCAHARVCIYEKIQNPTHVSRPSQKMTSRIVLRQREDTFLDEKIEPDAAVTTRESSSAHNSPFRRVIIARFREQGFNPVERSGSKRALRRTLIQPGTSGRPSREQPRTAVNIL